MPFYEQITVDYEPGVSTVVEMHDGSKTTLKKLEREFYARRIDGGLYAAGLIVQAPPIAPGATGSVSVPLYVGPQDQDNLAKLAKGLDLVVDYGIFTVTAAPLFWLLKWLYGMIGNWGWAIVAMTIIIKSAFYPLNHASARSMAKMKVIGPKLKALQEQYANDKQQLQIKMIVDNYVPEQRTRRERKA